MKSFKTALGVLLLLALTKSPPSEAQECSCVTDFEVLNATTMRNYAAYPIEVQGGRDLAYAEMTTRAREQARRATSTEACIYALREYTGWFADPHLFIAEFPRYTHDRLAAFRDEVEHRSFSRSEVLHYVEVNRADLDPIEGIWYDEASEIAVVRDSELGPDQFVGVVIESVSDEWAVGDVRARIRRVEPNEYRFVLYMDDRSPRHIGGALWKDGLLLRIAPYAWGRRYPVEPPQENLLHPRDPRAPTLHLRGPETVVISVPSHQPKYEVALAKLVQAHASDLQRVQTLFIDIRGNEGGSSRSTNSLEPYYYSVVQESASKTIGPPVVLASPDNLRAFQRWTEWYDPDPQWLTTLLHDLEERTGELVTYLPSDGEEEPVPDGPEIVHENPRHVAVLIDGGVVSAGEAFVLKTRRYDRVTIYGQPTRGSIDYQNVQLLPLFCRTRGFYLGYSTQAATTNLPEDGYNRTGIAPDVWIPATENDPISWVLRFAASETTDT